MNKRLNSPNSQTGKQKRWPILLPVAGVILFLIFYVLATRLYPGGSRANSNAVGFSWVHNYWCNLLSEPALNGQPNPARPIAGSGMIILCVALSIFWWQFPLHVGLSKPLQFCIQGAGIAAMLLAFLLFTQLDHDLATNLASGFGVVALVGTFTGLYQKGWYALFVFGLINLLLVAVNNYVYRTPAMLVYLPVIQKISFALFLSWVCGICFCTYKFKATDGATAG